MKEEFKPELVITHWMKDIHQDHRLVAEESFRVFRNTSVISYECTRSCPEFAANYFVDLTEEDVKALADDGMVVDDQAPRASRHCSNHPTSPDLSQGFRI